MILARRNLTPDLVCVAPIEHDPDADILMVDTFFGEQPARVWDSQSRYLDLHIAAELEATPGLVAAHAGWSHDGFVWVTPDGRWIETTYQLGVPSRSYIAGDLRTLVLGVDSIMEAGR